MATRLTDTGVTFNDGSIQATAADQLLLRSTISSAVSTYEYTGWYNANLRNTYQGIRIDISDIIASASAGNDYCLQFRWTDGTGTYGWATSSGTPYNYHNLRLVINQSNIDRYSDYNSDKILIGGGHGQLSGSVKILNIQDFNNSCIFSCYGTASANAHKFTYGGAKIENLSGEVRVIDGFRLFISGGATINSGVVSTYGIRR